MHSSTAGVRLGGRVKDTVRVRAEDQPYIIAHAFPPADTFAQAEEALVYIDVGTYCASPRTAAVDHPAILITFSNNNNNTSSYSTPITYHHIVQKSHGAALTAE
jgi:hypothetical protein